MTFRRPALGASLIFMMLASPAGAVCMNRFLCRSEGATRQVVTLLTGELTFQEAQALATAIRDKHAEPIEWVDDKGKKIAAQFGDIKVVRPMPVGCGTKASGVVMIVTFFSGQQPAAKMMVKLDKDTTVTFDQQHGE